jgi:hypothetical protein
MYRISENKLSENYINSSFNNLQLYPIWKIEMQNNDNGFFKQWNIGTQDIPLQSFKFSISEKGCITADLKFNKFDFPVYYGNEINIYYNNEKKFRGYITNIPNYKGIDTIKCDPYTKKLNEILINSTFTNYTFKEMIYDILTLYSTKLNIYYNEKMMKDYTDETIYSQVSYNYEKPQKIIEDYYQIVSNCFWGVDAYGYFYLKTRSTINQYNIYSGDNQYFSEIIYTKDYSKIDVTRYHIFQESTGEAIYIATIPDGTTIYSYLDYENEIGIKEEKITVPQGLNSTECKDYVYGKLKSIRVPENVKIKNLDIRKYDLSKGDRIRIYDESILQLKQIIDCESLDNWSTGTLDSMNKKQGNYSISFSSTDILIYDFGTIQKYEQIKKIVFLLRADKIGTYLQFSLGNIHTGYGLNLYGQGLYGVGTSTHNLFFDFTYPISIKNINSWNMIEINTTYDFRFIGIQRLPLNTTMNASLNIDDIRLYAYQNKYYEGNVIKLDYNINRENQYFYDVEIGDYSQLLNEFYFKMNRRVSILETMSQTTG